MSDRPAYYRCWLSNTWVPAMTGNAYMIHQLAIGLFNEWKQASPANRRNMWRQMMNMPPGPERLACVKTMRMAEEAERLGTA